MSARPGEGSPRAIMVLRTGEPVASVREARGEFHDMIRVAIGDAWAGAYDVADVRDEGADLPAPGSAAAFVITGSAANVPTRDPWMLRMEAWLREVVSIGTPTFGICFGHQILAQALGGEVRKNPRGREMGTVSVERRADDPLFDDYPARFPVNVIHLDTVAHLPPGARSLAWSALEDHHAIRFGEKCYGVQFHPEIDADIMRGYIEARREVLTGEGFDVDRMLAEVEEARLGRQTLRNFVRQHVR